MPVLGSKPDMGLIAEQLETSIDGAPWIMYGPVEMRSRPYVAGFVKHLPISGGTGAAAGSDSSSRKSPWRCVRWNTIVCAFGVEMPETRLLESFAAPVIPLMSPL